MVELLLNPVLQRLVERRRYWDSKTHVVWSISIFDILPCLETCDSNPVQATPFQSAIAMLCGRHAYISVYARRTRVRWDWSGTANHRPSTLHSKHTVLQTSVRHLPYCSIKARVAHQALARRPFASARVSMKAACVFDVGVVSSYPVRFGKRWHTVGIGTTPTSAQRPAWSPEH